MSKIDRSPILTDSERRLFEERTNRELYGKNLGDLANLLETIPGVISKLKEKLNATYKRLDALKSYKNGDFSKITHYESMQVLVEKYGTDVAIESMETVYKDNERDLKIAEIKYNIIKGRIVKAGEGLKSRASNIGKHTNTKKALSLALIFAGSISLLSIFQFQQNTGYFTAPIFAPNFFVAMPLTAIILAILGVFYLKELA